MNRKLQLAFYLLLTHLLTVSTVAQVRKIIEVPSNNSNWEETCGLNNKDNSSVVAWNSGELNIVKFDEFGNVIFEKGTTGGINYLFTTELYNDTTYVLTRDSIQNLDYSVIRVIDPNGLLINAVQIDSISFYDVDHVLYVYDDDIYVSAQHAEGFRVLSFDKNLNLNWDIDVRPTSNPNEYTGIEALTRCANGDLLLCGTIGYQMGLVRISSTGQVLWSKNYNFDIDYLVDAREITETADGSIFIVGMIGPDLDIFPFISKIDANGNLQWLKYHPEQYQSGASYGIVYYLGVEEFGSYLLVEGWSHEFTEIKVILDMNGEIVEARASNIGRKRDSKIRNNVQFSISNISNDSLVLEYTSAYGSFCEEIDLVFDPSVLVDSFGVDTAYTTELNQHGAMTFNGSMSLVNQNSIFTYVCGSPGDEQVLSISEEELLELNIYPNPVSDFLFIEASIQIVDVSLYSISGEPVSNAQFNGVTGIDMSNLKPGVYILSFIDDHGRLSTRKVIKT
jgi:hypothetical protein